MSRKRKTTHSPTKAPRLTRLEFARRIYEKTSQRRHIQLNTIRQVVNAASDVLREAFINGETVCFNTIGPIVARDRRDKAAPAKTKMETLTEQPPRTHKTQGKQSDSIPADTTAPTPTSSKPSGFFLSEFLDEKHG